MRAAFLVLLAVLVQTAVSSQTPPAGLVLEDLRDWLKINWYDTDFTDLGYSVARQQMYSFTDESGGNVECIYTGFQQPAEFTTFPDPINAEHLVPQSLYGSASPMRSDIHNLRPAHGSANSARSNYPFSEVDDANAVWYGVDGAGNYQSTSTQPANADDYSERYNSVWEPREARKGDVARQLFYFYTMYPTQAGDISLIGSVSLIYTWHLDDPVSADEIIRNDRIETAQGNRNPYIDHPELVYDAWLWVAVNGCIDEAACNYDAAANTDDGSCLFVGDPCDDGDAGTSGEEITVECICAVVAVSGCTDPVACNYNAAASVDDGSCEFISCAGCTDNTACNYDGAATLDDGSCEFISCAGCTDNTACNYDGAATLDDGSCEFNSCAGCVDNTACNYDPTATLPDVCTYPGDACDDGDATTTGEEITASCTCEVVNVPGCTDPLGCNYNPAATVNDGSCDFATCAGCMDNTACNYDATATLADVCTYPGDPCDDDDAATTGEVLGVDCSCAVPEVPGCTYDAANNYNPVATLDDGSCTFDPCTSVGCDGADVNDSGQVETGDLLAVLASFGAACD